MTAVPSIVITLDCVDPAALAPFWADALGYRAIGPFKQYIALVPPEDAPPGSPRVLLQGVPEAKRGKNRQHLDLHVEAIDPVVERLVAAGATRAGEAQTMGGTRWQILLDPEGNELCICEDAAGS